MFSLIVIFQSVREISSSQWVILGVVVVFIIGFLIMCALSGGMDEKQQEEVRGLPTKSLPELTDTQLLMLAMARLYKTESVDDNGMIDELYRRGIGNKKDAKENGNV